MFAKATQSSYSFLITVVSCENIMCFYGGYDCSSYSVVPTGIQMVILGASNGGAVRECIN